MIKIQTLQKRLKTFVIIAFVELIVIACFGVSIVYLNQSIKTQNETIVELGNNYNEEVSKNKELMAENEKLVDLYNEEVSK